MIKDAVNGFFMALADSVPGVSGGTVAFILGFYDRFIGAINSLFYGNQEERKQGFLYLIRLAVGWILGMCLAVVALNALFEKHIHVVSSLFIGFIVGAIPVVCMDEKKSVKEWRKGILFLLAGIALVVLVTYLNTKGSSSSLTLRPFSAGTGVRLFFVGMVSICAMFLPGISGSTVMLICGAYLPIMTALRSMMAGESGYLPAILCFILGIFAGAASVVKVIQTCLRNYRSQTIWFILGMMAGSLYAVVMGPSTLEVPQAPLRWSNFSWIACAAGIALVLLLEAMKKKEAGKAELPGR